MSRNLLPVIICALLAAIAVPFVVARNLQLGTFAKSPQEVEMSLGSSVHVAGGRAKLWFAGGTTGGDFEVSCREERRYVEPEWDMKYEACRIEVELVKVSDEDNRKPPRATYRVTWKD